MIQDLRRCLDLPKKQSFFLFGPRQTGKSTLIQQIFGAKAWVVDLLKSDLYVAFSKEPHRFRAEAEFQIVKNRIKIIVIDEVQKIPLLLDEVQYLMGKYREVRFILTGSSARKLKSGSANLLAGRAVQRTLFPFIRAELKHFDLLRALQFGTMPSVWFRNREDCTDILEAYSQMYLREEIQAEGIARNIGGFARFLDVAAQAFGEITNYSNIGRECMLSPRTVQGYYDILEDTLVGYRLPGWAKGVRKQLSQHPKFYFFDNGVVNALNHCLKGEVDKKQLGHLFEQWIMNEVRAALSYARSDLTMHYWRTKNDAEVDLVLASSKKPVLAIEFKYTGNISSKELIGLRSFREDHPSVRCLVVSDVSGPRLVDGIEILPWRKFMDEELILIAGK